MTAPAEIRPCIVCSAAAELIRASDNLREAVQVERNTQPVADRYQAADHVWNAVRNSPHTCHQPAPAQRRTP